MEEINSDIGNIMNWSKQNELLLNEMKTVVLVVSNSYTLEEIKSFTVDINGITIHASDEMKCLPITLDSKLQWSAHINNVAKKCYQRIRALYAVKPYVSHENLKILGQSLVLSLLYYMSAIWGRAKKSLLKSVEKVLRSLARLVMSARKFDPIAKIITQDLEWMFPNYLCQFTTLCITFKLLHCDITYFNDYYTKKSLVHDHTTRQTSDLHINFKPCNKYGRSMFYYNSIMSWNNLPRDIKNITSFVSFKRNLRKHLLEQQASTLT